jgi:hypothetical protein
MNVLQYKATLVRKQSEWKEWTFCDTNVSLHHQWRTISPSLPIHPTQDLEEIAARKFEKMKFKEGILR